MSRSVFNTGSRVRGWIRHDRSGLQVSWLGARRHCLRQTIRQDDVRKDRCVGVDQRVQIIFCHDLKDHLSQCLHSQKVIRLCRRVQCLGGIAKGSFQVIEAAGKLGIANMSCTLLNLASPRFAKVPVDRVAALVTARLRGEHAQIRAAGAGRNQIVIERHRNDMINRLGRLWKCRGKIFRQQLGSR